MEADKKQLGINANLGEAILHLKYLDDEYPEEGKGSTAANTAQNFANSSHFRQDVKLTA